MANTEDYLSAKEKKDFINSLFIYYKSGIPLIDSIKKISDKTTLPGLKATTREIYKELSRGKPFNDVMIRYEKHFGRVIVGLLISGEQSGKLIKVLIRVKELLQKQNQIRQKIISALTYPAMLILMAMVVLCIFYFFVFPMLEGGGQVNILTQAISFVIKTSILFGILFAIIIFAHKTHFVDKKLIPSLSNFPVIGDMVKSANYANFFLVMLVSYEGGLSAAAMLDLASETIKQSETKKKMRQALKHVMDGSDISNSLTITDAMPEEYIAAIAEGEASGELDKALTEIINEIDENTDNIIGRLSKLIEPTVMVVMGIIICIILVQVYGKLYSGKLF